MHNIFEQCTVDGELTPELIKRKQELDQSMEAELAEVEAGRGQQWIPKERQYAEIHHKYEELWEQELEAAGYFLRPTFEGFDADNWYEELNKINEWVDAKGNKVSASSSTSTASAAKSITKKRPKVKTMFGIAESWEDEFVKLDSHLRTVNPLPAQDHDRRITPIMLRTYWTDRQGLERRLEVTTTKAKNFKSYEQWDYVLSVEDNGEKIISRGYIKDYEALLDILLKTGDIADKSKCI